MSKEPDGALTICRTTMKAMILAAGRGERLRPLTAHVPKALIPVLNVPAIVHTLTYLRNWGITEAVINLHHEGAKVRRALGNGTELGMHIEYSEEQLLMGTAGGIKKAEHLLSGGTFVAINADVLTAVPLAEVLSHHRNRRALATLVLRQDAEAEKYGTLAMGAGGRILRLLDLRVGSEPHELVAMFTGIHLLEPEIFHAIPPGRPCGITEETYPALLKAGAPVFGHLYSGYWADIGRPANYLAAHLALMDGKLPMPDSTVPDGRIAQVGHGARVGPLSKLLPPVLVGGGCTIEDGAQVGPGTTIGDRACLARGCIVRGSVLWDNVTVGAEAIVTGSIIASDATIAARARVDRMIVTPNESVLMDAE